jgi:hypothetical protein
MALDFTNLGGIVLAPDKLPSLLRLFLSWDLVFVGVNIERSGEGDPASSQCTAVYGPFTLPLRGMFQPLNGYRIN